MISKMSNRLLIWSSRLFLLVSLFYSLWSTKKDDVISANESSVFLVLRLDSKVFPTRNSGLIRHSRAKTLSPLLLHYRLKAGIFLAKAGLFSIYLIMLASDVSINPRPILDSTVFGVTTNSSSFTTDEDPLSDIDSLSTADDSDSELTSSDDEVDDEVCDPYPYFDLGLGNMGICFGTWNVNRLITAKFDQIKLFLLGRNNRPQIDILSLNETFLKPTTPDSFYSVPGFTIDRRDRKGIKKGGGVLVYVNDEISHQRRTDLEDSNVEAIWVEFFPFKSNRSLLFSDIYRPPSSSKEDDERLEKTLRLRIC